MEIKRSVMQIVFFMRVPFLSIYNILTALFHNQTQNYMDLHLLFYTRNMHPILKLLLHLTPIVHLMYIF